tara:strand:- start:351 stop:632 length:282 start_codon:yes stop_codon:yes gene_type:complete
MLPALGKTEENNVQQEHPTVEELFNLGLADNLAGSLVRIYYDKSVETQGIVLKSAQDGVGNRWLEVLCSNSGLCVYPAYSLSIQYRVQILSRA